MCEGWLEEKKKEYRLLRYLGYLKGNIKKCGLKIKDVKYNRKAIEIEYGNGKVIDTIDISYSILGFEEPEEFEKEIDSLYKDFYCFMLMMFGDYLKKNKTLEMIVKYVKEDYVDNTYLWVVYGNK